MKAATLSRAKSMIPLLVPCLSVPFAGLTIWPGNGSKMLSGKGKDKDEGAQNYRQDWFTLVAFAGTMAVLLWLKF